MAARDPLENCIGFDWDQHNEEKNWELHHVTPEEAEDVFFHEPLVIRGDVKHSKQEKALLRSWADGNREDVICFVHRPWTFDPGDLGSRYESEWRKRFMESKKKAIPEFKTEEDERAFWSTADSTKYIDWSSAKRRKLVQLRPTLRTISLRLPVAMIEDLKVLANQRDVPYQSLLKVFLAERLVQERRLDAR